MVDEGEDLPSVDNILWLERQSGQERTAFAARMGMTYQGYISAIRRGRFQLQHLCALARSLDISLDFLAGLHDEPTPLARNRAQTFWEIIAERER